MSQGHHASNLLSGCDKSEDNRLEYLAVQLSEGGRWSIIDKNGKMVAKDEYPADATISYIYDGVYWVKTGDKYQLYNVDNPKKPVTKEKFESVTTFFQTDRAAVSTQLGQPIRIINTKGETVATLPESIRECHSFGKDGYAVVRGEGGKFGVVDTNGKLLIEPTYTNLQPLGEGVFLAELRQFLDAQGNVLGEIDPQKYVVTNLGMEKGKMIVRDASTRLCCVINQKGEEEFALPMAVDASYYKGGYAPFRDASGLWGILDDDGDVVVQPQYPMLFNIGGGEFIVNANGGFGVINAQGETIVDFNYNGGFDPEKVGDNFIMARNYEYMLVNKQGEELATFKKFGQFDHPVAYYRR